jgi:hypothetical protein
MRCLAKKREERWSDVGELARALAPYGSGTWIQSADRVTATLARPMLDDSTSGTRLKNSGPQHFGMGTPQQIPIPGIPGKRLDSLQPELTGTASTVARRFTMFDSNKRWLIVAALAVPAVVGIGLIGLTMSAKARAGDAAAAGSASAEPPPDPVTIAQPAASVEVTPAGPATAVITTGNGQASPENELPTTAPAGTVLGAAPSTPNKQQPKAAAYSRPAAPPQPAPNPYPAKQPPPTSGTARPALPPGLPLTRQ